MLAYVRMPVSLLSEMSCSECGKSIYQAKQTQHAHDGWRMRLTCGKVCEAKRRVRLRREARKRLRIEVMKCRKKTKKLLLTSNSKKTKRRLPQAMRSVAATATAN